MTNDNNSSNIWLIAGEAYDLSKFKHPGGPIALELGRNRDCTFLFKSYHPFTEKPLQILKKYKTTKPKNCNIEVDTEFDVNSENFYKDSPFFEELKKEVKEKVFKNGEVPVYANTTRWLQLLGLFLLMIFNAYFFWKGHWWALFSFPLSYWVFGVNTFHDGSHFAISKKWRINSFFTYLHFIFSSSFSWYHQHVIGHHVYPNIHNKDPDIQHSPELWRLHERQRYRKHFILQPYYVYIIFCFATLGLITIVDATFIFTGYLYTIKSMEMSRKRKIVHILGRIFTLFFIYGLQLFNSNLTSTTQMIIWMVVPYSIFSFCFGLNSQINHVVAGSYTYDRDWHKHQVITAHNVAPNSLLMFFFTGGLNLQVEHHLFPGVNHWHLRKIQPITQRLCEKYGIKYHVSKSGFEAIRKYASYQFYLATDPATLKSE